MTLATDDAFPCPWCGRNSRPADPVERLGDRTRVCDACNLVYAEGERQDYSAEDLAAPQMSDGALIALYAANDQERRQDGRLYRIHGDASICPDCLGAGMIEETARRRPTIATTDGHCLRCSGRGYIGVPPGQRMAAQPPERDHLGRFTMPPLPDGTRPAEPVPADGYEALKRATIEGGEDAERDN